MENVTKSNISQQQIYNINFSNITIKDWAKMIKQMKRIKNMTIEPQRKWYEI